MWVGGVIFLKKTKLQMEMILISLTSCFDDYEMGGGVLWKKRVGSYFSARTNCIREEIYMHIVLWDKHEPAQ